MIAMLLLILVITGIAVRALHRRALVRQAVQYAWAAYAVCLTITAAIWYLVHSEILSRTTISVFLVYATVGYFGLYEGYRLMRYINSEGK
jgi:hypothetical protein